MRWLVAGAAGVLRPLVAVHNARFAAQKQPKLIELRNRSTVFVHIPKTAGSSLGTSILGQPPGHFTLTEHLQVRRVPVERVIFVTRDPVDRLRSAFSHIKLDVRRQPSRHVHQFLTREQGSGRWTFAAAPFWLLAACTSLEFFVRSPLFPTMAAEHFFFRPQIDYLNGLDRFRGEVAHLRFERFQADAKRLLGIELPHLNARRKLPRRKLELSPYALECIRRAYAEDFALHEDGKG